MTGRKTQGTFRIIGGRWRGRKLTFAPVPGLRPTPDRVRETLFNWLAPDIHGARCLDLFAGSGALGFEALSRGAAQVTLVDSSRAAVARLKENAQRLGAADATIAWGDALSWLTKEPVPAVPFDVIFADPPFESDLLARLCTLLSDSPWLAPNGRLYVEFNHGHPPDVAAAWQVWRTGRAGQVGYGLLVRQPGDDDPAS